MLRIDGAEQVFAGSGVAITNSIFYGAGVPIAPAADVHDGLLDVVMFDPTTRLTRTTAMIALARGRHLGRLDVRHQLAHEVRVDVHPATAAYSDGDPMCLPPFTARVLPGAIRLLRP